MTGLISKFQAAHLNKTSVRRSRSGRSGAIALALAAAAWAGSARATTLFIWDPDGNAANNNQSGAGVGGSGTWDNSTVDWWYSTAAATGTETAWNSSLQACITGPSTNNITLGANVVDTQGILSYVNYDILAGSNTLQLGGTLIVSGGVATIAAPIVGTGFTSQSGTLVLSGNNSFSGFYNLSSGQVNLDSSTALGTATFDITGAAAIDTNGQTISNNNAQLWNANFTFGGSGTLNMGSGPISLGTAAGTSRTITVKGNTLIEDGVISNGTTANSLILAGAGSLALGGSNTYTGGTTVSAGTLDIDSGAALGTGTLTMSGGNLDNTTGSPLTVSNNNAQTWSSNFTFVGSANLNLGTGGVNLSGAARTVTVNANTLTVGGVISNGSLIKAGGASLALTGANTFSSVSVNAGTVDIDSSVALGTGTLITGGGNIDNTTGSALTVSTVTPETWNSNFAFIGSQNLDLGTGPVSLGTTAGTSRTVAVYANTLTIDGVISNGTTANSLNVAGTGTIAPSGTLSLTAAEAYTGATIVSAGGTLSLSGSLASPSLVLAGGTFSVAASQAGQAFASGTSLTTGNSAVTAFYSSNNTLALGALTRSPGGTVDFTLPTSGSITTTTANASFPGGQQTILGGYATVGGTTWAVSGSGATAGAISALPQSGYATTFTPGADVDAPTGNTAPGTMTINSLRFNSSSNSYAINDSGAGDTLTVATGGILETANLGGNSVTFGVQNLTSGNGTDLILIQNNPSSPMTINSNIVGNISLTKAGAGQLVLNGSNSYTGTTYLSGSGSVTENANTTLNTSNAANTNFTGGLIMNAGTLVYNADNNLGEPSSGVTLNSATVNFIGTSAITDTHVFNVESNSTFNVAVPGGAGGKITFSGANLITGSGNLTKTGPGWLSIGGANNNYSGNWIINAGVIEASAGALGTGVSVTVNGDGSTNPTTAGELAANNTNLSNFIVLNGGILSGDNGTSTYSGNINVEANSTIRLGDFYGSNNRSLVISGEIFGSGNLSLANSLSNLPTNSYLGTQNQMLTLSGPNAGYAGTLTVDGGHGVIFSNSGAIMPNIVATNTSNAIPIIAQNFDLPSQTQTPTISTANGSMGVFALGGFSSSGSDTLNLSTLYGGGWYFGSDVNNVSYFGHITPATVNGVPTYHLGGGDGGLFLGNNGEVAQQGTTVTNVVIGAAMIGGTGLVHYGNQMTATGTTTINAGSVLDMDFPTTGTTTNLSSPSSALVLDGGTFTLTGKANSSNAQSINGVTINPGGTSSIQDNANATANPALLALNAITRNVGGTVDFSPPTGTANTNNGITTTTTSTNGIIGGWATYQQNTWAVSASNGSSPGLISGLPLASYVGSTAATTAPGATANVDFQASNTTPWATQSINSLRFVNASSNTLTLAGTLTIASGGILEGSAVANNPVVITGGTVEGAAGADLIVNDYNTANSLTINSVIADNTSPTALTKSGNGNLILGASDTFTGPTYDNAGTITLNNSLALQNSTLNFNVVSGGLSFGSLTSATLGGLAGNQYVNLASTAGAVALSVGNNNASTNYSGNMLGAGSLTKIGTGTLTMGGNNNYSGGTVVNAGTLRVTGTMIGASGTVAINGGATLSGTGTVNLPVIAAGGSSTATQGSVSLIDGTIDSLTLNNGLTVGSSSAPSSLGFDINSTTSDLLSLGSSTFTVNQGGAAIHVNSLVSGTFITSGTTYNVMSFGSGAGAGFATGSGTTVGSITLANPTLTFGVSGILNVTNTAISVTTTVSQAPSVAYWAGVWGNTWSATDPTVSFGNFTTDPGGVNYVTALPGPSTSVYFAASGNGAPKNLTNTLGTNFDIDGLTFLSGFGAINIGGAQQLQIEGDGITVQSGAGPVTLDMANLVLGSTQTWTSSGSSPLTVSSNVSGGGALTTIGNVIMTGTNNYSGGTTVSSGELQLGGGGSLNTTGNLTVNGTLDMNGSNVTIATLSGAGTGIITNGPGASGNVTLTSNDNSDSVYAGLISDSGAGKTLSLVKNGTNSLTLSGNNTYTGGTTLNAGTLVAGSSTPLGSGPLAANNGTFDLNAAGSNSGGAQSVSIGSLSGANATITDNNGNSGVTTLNVNQSNTATFGGTLTDGSSRQIALSKTGSATLSLANAGNNYSGGTTITAGTVVSVVPGAVGSGQVTLSGGTLSLGQMVSGFGSNGSGWTVNQSGVYSITPTPITNNVLTITDNSSGGNQGRFAFFNAPQAAADGFTANFVYTPGGAKAADGVAFAIENDPRGANITDGTGGSLGVSGLADSGAVLLNLYNNVSQTGFAADGPGGALPYVTMTGVNLHTGGPNFDVSLSYNPGTQTLSETVTDETTPSDVFTTSYTGVNFQSLLGSNAGYVGFVGSDGGAIASQTISDFTFQSGLTSTWSNNILAAAGTASGIQLGVMSPTVGSLTVQAGASVAVTGASSTGGHTGQALSVASLNIAGNTGNWTGKLDLGGNDMVVQNGSLATITNQVAQGYNNGTWQGSGGIVSSAAAADTTHLTALGVIQNTADGVDPLYSTFDGLTNLTASDVLVKYTYYGDANLDGAVDASDYSLIDNGYLNHLTGWYNGDFNYDGVINGSDYTLIDNAFNMQGASLAAADEIASPTAEISGGGTSAVPEPTSIALLGAGALGLLGRRRRK